MINSDITDLLEQLIYMVKKDKLAELSIYHRIATDDYVLHVERIIRELKDGDKDKQDGGMADDGE